MRNLLLFASLLIVRAAHAESADEKAFREFVVAQANEDKGYVEQLFTANLDSDPALERVAVVCMNSADGERKGFFFIEKDAAHRWELTFDVDSRTRACKGKPTAPLTFEARKSPVIELYQGHLQGYESTSYALRLGGVVIVREEESAGEGKKPEVKDWDALIKKKKAKTYQAPEKLRAINGT